MDVIKFNLSGKTAFFKKPEVNAYLYFTFSHIHKVALLGVLGSVLGLGGYEKQKTDKSNLPDFYEKLNGLTVAIVPHKYVFNKKQQTFNNSVGYASKEEGGNLIVKEQWLEDVSWDIYLKDAPEELKEALLNCKCKYVPYLGKNDHFANILNVETLAANPVTSCECTFISSICRSSVIEKISSPFGESYSKYEERLPVAIEPNLNQYILEKFTLTNGNLKLCNCENVYSCDGKNLFFF